MLHHASLPVEDLGRAAALYDAALAPLGYRRVCSGPGFAGYGVEDGKDKLALKQTLRAAAAGPGFRDRFANAYQHPDHVVVGQVDNSRDGVGIKSDHGAGIVSHVFGRQHDGLRGNPHGAHGFIALQLLFHVVNS